MCGTSLDPSCVAGRKGEYDFPCRFPFVAPTITAAFNEIRDFSVDLIEYASASVERIETTYLNFEAFIIRFS